MGILKNSWVVGIITGIISGLFVFFATNFIFDNKRKRDYNQHKKEANADVVNALKPYIAEQGLPEYEVLFSLIKSTSRKYSVNREDLFTPSQVCEELIREVLGDVYISSEKKKEYTENVAKYKSMMLKIPETVSLEKDNYKQGNDVDKTIGRTKILFGIITGIMLLLLSAMVILFIVNPELAKYIWFFPSYTYEGIENIEAVYNIMLVISLGFAILTISFTLLLALNTMNIFRGKKKKKSKTLNEKKEVGIVKEVKKNDECSEC